MKPLLITLLSGAALIAGYFAANSSTPTSVDLPPLHKSSAASVAPSKVGRDYFGDALDANDLKLEGKFAFYSKLESASESDIQSWAEEILADVELTSRDMTGGEQILYETWAEQAPGAAFDRVLSMGSQHSHLLTSPLNFAARAPDPDLLRELIASLPKNLIESSPYLLQGALHTAAKSYGFETAVDLALSNPAGESIVSTIYRQWIADAIQKKQSLSDIGKFAMSQSTGVRSVLLKTLGAQWSAVDTDAAMRWGDGLEDTKAKTTFKEAVVGKLLASGDANAVQYLSQTPDLDLAKTVGIRSMGGLGPILNLPDDSAELREFVAKFRGKNKETVLVAAAQKAAKKGSPELLADLLKDLPAGGLRTKLAENFGGTIRQMNSMTGEELLSAIETFPDIADQDSALIAAAGARDFWVSFGDSPKIKPGEVLTKLENLDLHAEAVSSLALDWMFQDKAAAVEWMNSLPDGEAKHATMARIMPRLAAESDDALAWVRGLPESEQRSNLFKEAATWKAIGDYEKGLLWAKGLPEADRHIAASALIENMAANSKPDAAAEMLTAWLSEIDPAMNTSEHAGKAAAAIATGWAKNTPTDAKVWVNALPDGATKASAAAALAKTWVASDTVAVSEWISDLSDGPVQTAAATELIEHIYRYDPESAMAWAGSINDGSEAAERLMLKAFSQWRRFDPEGADAAGKDAKIIVLDDAATTDQ